MWPHSFIPIRRVIPWRIGTRYRRGKLIHRWVGENFTGRMGRVSRPQWLSLPMDPQSRAVDIFRVGDASNIAKRRPPLPCGERQDQRQREPREHYSRQQRAESRGAKRSSGDAAEAERTEQENESQGKDRSLRKITKTEQCAESRKHQPVAPAATNAKQQRRSKIHKRSNAEVRRYPLWAQPKITGPQEKHVSPNPHRSRGKVRRFLWRFACRLLQQNEFIQKKLERGEARRVHPKIQQMRRRKFPLRRRMKVPKDKTQEKRIERAPVSIDNLIQPASRRGPADFDIRNAVRRHVIAVRPHAQQPQNHDNAPEENSRTRFRRRADPKICIHLFHLCASQLMHSSSAAKVKS